jgi:hypothetical protein
VRAAEGAAAGGDEGQRAAVDGEGPWPAPESIDHARPEAVVRSEVHEVPRGQREGVERGDLTSMDGAAGAVAERERRQELWDGLLSLVLHPGRGLRIARQDAVAVGFDVVLTGLVEVGEPQRHRGCLGMEPSEQLAERRVALGGSVERRVGDDDGVRVGEPRPGALHDVVDRRAEVRAAVGAPVEGRGWARVRVDEIHVVPTCAQDRRELHRAEVGEVGVVDVVARDRHRGVNDQHAGHAGILPPHGPGCPEKGYGVVLRVSRQRGR